MSACPTFATIEPRIARPGGTSGLLDRRVADGGSAKANGAGIATGPTLTDAWSQGELGARRFNSRTLRPANLCRPALAPASGSPGGSVRRRRAFSSTVPCLGRSETVLPLWPAILSIDHCPRGVLACRRCRTGKSGHAFAPFAAPVVPHSRPSKGPRTLVRPLLRGPSPAYRLVPNFPGFQRLAARSVKSSSPFDKPKVTPPAESFKRAKA